MNARSGIHVWSLQKRLQEFINADNGVKFQSGGFPVADFKWQIIAYPNGNRFENYGSVMLYLKLLGYPSDLPYGGQVTVNFRIQCRETHSSSTFIETYNRINDSKGWSSRNLLLSDLTKESINKITFQVDVKILKISNQNGRITYEAPLKIYKNRFNLKWIVQDDTIARFQYANNGKWFESGNYSNLWCFKCAPNGYNDKNEGAALLFIQLCALPPNISKMKCKVKLFHVESDTKWSVKKDFGYDNKNAGWTKNKLSYEKLMKYDTITFRAEIEILTLFDLKGDKSVINPQSSANYKYQAKKAYDDGSIAGKNSKFSIKNRGNRSATTTAKSSATKGGNPYGGYGSDNYHLYFNDGYKKYNAQKAAQQKQMQQQRSHESKEDSESENDSEDENGQSSENEEDEDSEIELETFPEMKDQVKFLQKEYKKLHKIVSNLKTKSKSNDKLIAKLQADINALKNGLSLPSTYVTPNNTTSSQSNTKSASSAASNGGGILDLFGDMGSAPTTTAQTTQPQKTKPQNNDTFTTNGDDGGFGGWTTF